MPRALSVKAIGKVIDALRDGPKRWSDLVDLGIPKKTLERILKNYLGGWGMVYKNEIDGRWYWRYSIRTYESEREYTLFQNHSEKLIPSLEKMVTSYPSYWQSIQMESFTSEPPVLKEEAFKLIPFVEEHLKTGYPDIWNNIKKVRDDLSKKKRVDEEIRKLMGKSGEELGLWPYSLRMSVEVSLSEILPRAVLPSVHKIDGFRKNAPELLEEIVSIVKEWLEDYKRLAGDIELLILKIKMGEPLRGKCRICPWIKIKEE